MRNASRLPRGAISAALVSIFASGPPQDSERTAVRQDYFELRGGLHRAARVFQSTSRGRVAFLGGSITYNSGWREDVCKYLKGKFPDTSFEFVAAGIPSTGSTPGAFRLERDVFRDGPVDLLFEEAAVNDSTNGRSDDEQLRAMEGIVRRARTLNQRVEIVLMHFVDPEKMRLYGAGTVPSVIRNHERVAEHYRLTSIDLALEVTERIARGEFTWEDDFRDLHPSPFGQKVYARSIRRTLDAAWVASNAVEPDLSERPLPEPLDPFCYDRGRLVSPSTIQVLDGFRFVERWSNDVGGGTRSGFVDVSMLLGEMPGASFELEFRGTAVGLFVAAGPDAGVLEFRVDDGAWREQDLFTRWSAGLHLPWLYVLEAELDEAREHRLEVRIAPTRNPKSTGSACRLVHIALNDA